MRTAWVLGNGPTLPVEHLHRLAGEFAVGVNLIGRAWAPPVVVYFHKNMAKHIREECPDALVVNTYRFDVAGPDRWARSKRPPPDADLLLDAMSPGKAPGPTVLRVKGSVACAAAEWCLGLGFERVALLGMSGKPSADGVSHFHGDVETRDEVHRRRMFKNYQNANQYLYDTYGDRVFHADNPDEWPELTGKWSPGDIRAFLAEACA